ncbi:hypothetical protein [Candidatus Magnetobacterium casense]|uniref:Uncharacterized protein n=1 Tax=Candidatus Magnetobacterium casense TaxID=1455061 RepID=A0ABS6S4Z1_9BACT|nr:hypothetical protein [Candidatus Magnetobacterium casensis]MBV6343493.1 hypothetical protein [Candidatus Magnetobacterium casensis]
MAILGQLGPSTAGTPVQESDLGPGTYRLWAHPANGGTYMYLGYTSETATSAVGVVLKKGEEAIIVTVTDASDIWVDSDTDANVICYLKLEGESVGLHPPVSW